MPTESNFVVAASAGVSQSKGHDLYAAGIIETLREQNIPCADISLRPPLSSSASFLVKGLWERIEGGKETLSALDPNSLPAQALNRLASVVRTSPLVNVPLADEFNQRLRQLYEAQGISEAALVSSHLMAFNGTDHRGAPKSPVRVMVGPDLRAHQQAAENIKAGRTQTVLSPNPQYTQSLIEMGAPKDRILPWSPVFPDSITGNMLSQLGEDPSDIRILSAIGGSAFEAAQMSATLMHAVDAGFSTTVICGDNHPAKLRMQRALKDFTLSGTDHRADRLELFGGTETTNRKVEIAHLMAALKKPFQAILSRPNELAVIATALGIPVILFDPFQTHEEWAYHFMLQNGLAIAAGENGTLPHNFERFVRDRLQAKNAPHHQYPIKTSKDFAAIFAR